MKRQVVFICLFLSAFQFFSCDQSNIREKSEEKIDDIPPTLLSAAPVNNTHVVVYFSDASGEMDRQSAEDPHNYAIPGLSVTGAERDTNDLSRIVLTTSSQAINTTYTLTVTNVMDKFLNKIETQNTASFMGDGLPYILAVYPVDNTTFNVVFSESVNGLEIADFSIAPALAINNLADINNGRIYEFTTASQNASAYTLQISAISGIEDANGNSIDDWNATNPTRKQGNFTGDALPVYLTAARDGTASILVTFSDPMDDTAEINDYNNYRLWLVAPSTDITAYITSVNLDLGDATILHVNLTMSLTNGEIYELEIIPPLNAFQDLNGNDLTTPFLRQFTW